MSLSKIKVGFGAFLSVATICVSNATDLADTAVEYRPLPSESCWNGPPPFIRGHVALAPPIFFFPLVPEETDIKFYLATLTWRTYGDGYHRFRHVGVARNPTAAVRVAQLQCDRYSCNNKSPVAIESHMICTKCAKVNLSRFHYIDGNKQKFCRALGFDGVMGPHCFVGKESECNLDQ
jgi:hypothetical protein